MLQRLADYRILREIGRGGMGVVYEAEQESLGRRVALKVLSASSLPDPKQVRRFEREEGRGAAAPHQHRTDLRRGTSGRAPLFRDAVHRRSGA
jgi:serine/threonine protein kinase